MGGGLMQLVAYGAQDVYLTGNPQITFFKVVYRRHTNFSMECIQQTINGTSTLGAGSTSGTVTISRNGDLVNKIYVTSVTASIENGSEIVNEVELEIGGQRIDRHTAEWMQVWNELTTPESKANGLKAMIGDVGSTSSDSVRKVHIPLQFWFCRNPGLALPLIALQYHEVKLKCTWGTSTAVGAAAAVQVWADYIYLDTDERRRFAQISHEYLIEQIQFTTVNAASTKEQLNFNHPVKELIWTTTGTTAASTKTKLTLNGHDRFAEQEVEYFQLRQPYDHHTAIPAQNIPMKEIPVMLAQPELVVRTAAVSATTAAADDSFAIIAHATTNQLLIRTADAVSVKIGDILLIHYPTTADAETETIVVKITAVPATYVVSTTDQAFSFLLCKTSATTTGVAPTVSEIGNGTIYKIGSVQNPLCRTSKLTRKINCYSFALKPEEHQPSGTCNFSRIDNANLVTTGTAPTIQTIFAINYNVLRIMSGMGGLAYSN